MKKLRGPDGCPWDRKQSHQSIRRYLLEEAYEAFDALLENNWMDFKEELGDLLFQVIFHAEMAEETGRFNITDIISSLSQKLKSRHPYLFKNGKIKTAAQQVLAWEELKTKEKNHDSALDRVPRSMPALMQAYALQSKANNLGFKWIRFKDVCKKVEEELQEWVEACQQKNKKAMEEELGDLLFTVTNLARWLNLNTEEALHKTNQKFRKRFAYLEKEAQKRKRSLKKFSTEELETFWRQAKGRHDG